MNDLRNLRTGLGMDVHAFAPGRKLILGGVDIPHHQGLDGHSDADVLAHAISDALLGAVRGGDIGKLFPDTDPAYKDADFARVARRGGSLCARARFRDHRRGQRHRRPGAEALALPRGYAREPGSGHGVPRGKRRRKGHHHRALGATRVAKKASPPTPPASCAAFNDHQNLT